MNNILKTALLPAVVCVFCITACTTLPAKALYTESKVTDVTVNDDFIDSIPFRYDDVKKAYDFFHDTEDLEATRQKQLHIARAAEQAGKEKKAIVETEQISENTDSVTVNSEESSAENQ